VATKGEGRETICDCQSLTQTKSRAVTTKGAQVENEVREGRLRLLPLTLAQANDLIERLHRHHKRVVGHRFSIGCQNGKGLVGAVVVGRPVARMTDQNNVAEITRLVTDGTPHACSMLYAAAARAAKAMGYLKIQTFILESEPGTSLRAAGFKFEAMSGGGDWNRPSRSGRRVDQPMDRKKKWSKVLNG